MAMGGLVATYKSEGMSEQVVPKSYIIVCKVHSISQGPDHQLIDLMMFQIQKEWGPKYFMRCKHFLSHLPVIWTIE